MPVFVEFAYSGIFMVCMWNILCRLMYLVPNAVSLLSSCRTCGTRGCWDSFWPSSLPPLLPLSPHRWEHACGEWRKPCMNPYCWHGHSHAKDPSASVSQKWHSLLPQVSPEEWQGLPLVHVHVSTNAWAVCEEKKIYKLAHSFFPDDCNLMLLP